LFNQQRTTLGGDPLAKVGSKSAGSAAGGIIFLFLLVAGIALYFVPSFIAFGRKHHNRGAILMVNILLGWSFIGWVVAFIWSMTNPPPPQVPPQS
jgi:hypothetical protein